MLSRMPQILQIIGSDVSIIRSNIKNTMQHQRRDLLEATIRATNVPEVIDLTTPAPPAPAPAPAPAPVPVPVPVPVFLCILFLVLIGLSYLIFIVIKKF
jgi:hypothetical protein